jgi:hypothetical protein
MWTEEGPCFVQNSCFLGRRQPVAVIEVDLVQNCWFPKKRARMPAAVAVAAAGVVLVVIAEVSFDQSCWWFLERGVGWGRFERLEPQMLTEMEDGYYYYFVDDHQN